MTVSKNTRTTLLAIAWPIFVEQALRMAIGTVDTFMVSHVSDDAVAALGVAHQLIIFFLIIFNFIVIGASVVLTHHLGAHDHKGADAITHNAIAVNMWIGLAASVFVLAFTDPLLRLMQLPEELMPHARPFLLLMGGTLFLESVGMSIGAVLRAHKHTQDAMYVAVGQNILNVLGNCVLLYGLLGAPKLGVLGVAISGVISRVAAAAALWFLLKWRTGLALRVSDFFRVHRGSVRRILKIGLPAAGENLCYWIAFMLVTTFVARMGADSLAVQSYTLTIQRMVMIFSFSIGLGTEILIGHLIGAGRFDDAYDELLRSVRKGLLLAIAAIGVVVLAAPWLVGLFTEKETIIASSVVLLRISLLLEPGRVFNVVIISSLRATGDVKFPLQMAIFSMWCVWVFLAWFLGVHLAWGLPGIWLAMTADEWVRGLMMYRRWKGRKWVEHARHSHAHVATPAVAPGE
ncbi:MATE family efflux transporter [Nibricoccus sp. IMCC34717]|uniref:MATE family efflux transporter n=1 Tax=Nibricoccus sp. IMCC34717 TaxID=3034021 RepID=UPI0038516436